MEIECRVIKKVKRKVAVAQVAFVGVAIWYINNPRPITALDICLLIFALILTSLSPSDLFPRYLKDHYVDPYALKALPCFLIWLKIIYDTLFRKFDKKDLIAVVA